MRINIGRYLTTSIMSLLLVASGVLGFQIGQPSAEELAERVDRLDQRVNRLQGQVSDLSLYAGREMSWIAETSESEFLWVYLAIPAEEYRSSQTNEVCDGYSDLTPSNLGAADTLDNPLIRPSYGIYVGTSSYTGSSGDFCMREYFFPDIPRSRSIYIGDWITQDGLNNFAYTYWELSWDDVDWNDPFVTLNVDAD